MKIWEIYRSENTDVGTEEGVDAHEKTYLFSRVIDKGINEMRNKNTTGDNDIHGACSHNGNFCVFVFLFVLILAFM
jgi:hypothetical protein